MGYADNPEATKKKILADVFEKGDAFFRSGDLMSMDQDGEWCCMCQPRQC
jgi:long-subunit acyl-CoA synthetase (AMP-forming)